MASRKKIFVLDTNVILHDSSCIYHFEENDVVIPITVIEELDQFKKGNESINFHAREFLRNLDSISGDKLFSKGVNIDDNKGKILIKLNKSFHEDLKYNFRDDFPDHQILNCAYSVFKENQYKKVVLVSKDVNLRMKAKSVGIPSQDYKSDQVKDISSIYSGCRIVENFSSLLINELYKPPYKISFDSIDFANELNPNEFMILKNGKKSALGFYNSSEKTIDRLEKSEAFGISSRNAEQAFALSALLNDDIKLVTISGKAGTGKTLLSLAAAIQKRKKYLQIYIARPIVPLSNKDIGYLPGDVNEKLIPYMQPLYDNLGVVQNQFKRTDKNYKLIENMLKEEKLKIEPLSYIRGRSLVRIFFIVDEAQNLTPHEIKTIITRAGEGTKVIFTGDIFQIDHPYLDTLSNGLSYLIEKMKGQNLFAHINLEKGERSELAEIASNLL
ncbi:MAG: ribonuclease [Candidatus Dadabacteria bacterium]|nr:ribonuclease [Candidatus Dadabacteria bacterium]NIQ16685.1 ribonuclease [Candidatus Dadabacteria bacterium]